MKDCWSSWHKSGIVSAMHCLEQHNATLSVWDASASVPWNVVFLQCSTDSGVAKFLQHLEISDKHWSHALHLPGQIYTQQCSVGAMLPSSTVWTKFSVGAPTWHSSLVCCMVLLLDRYALNQLGCIAAVLRLRTDPGFGPPKHTQTKETNGNHNVQVMLHLNGLRTTLLSSIELSFRSLMQANSTLSSSLLASTRLEANFACPSTDFLGSGFSDLPPLA